MPLLPSLCASADRAQAWSVTRAAAYGAGLGALAALFKAFGPLHGSGAAGHVVEIAAAASVFALLCAGGAALRNFIARALIWRE
jgi:hypothetical protein